MAKEIIIISSTPGFNAPDMVRGYKKARACGDMDFIAAFESHFEKNNMVLHNSISDGRFTITKDNNVFVEIDTIDS